MKNLAVLQALHSNLVIFKYNKSCFQSYGAYFTFQSGYIQISVIFQYRQSAIPLHSNLVIFKSTFKNKTINAYLVIFKLSKLPSSFSINFSLHSNLVIFKLNFQIKFIYFLFTLHSNLVIFKFEGQNLTGANFTFTFQSGYIQICVPHD